MGWIFLAVVFYTVVKYGVRIWTQLKYEEEEGIRNAFTLQLEKNTHAYAMEIQRLKDGV